MAKDRVAALLEAAAYNSPDDVRRLARIVSPAARIEPELLRSARLALLPGAEAGIEADLWHSPWVQSRSPLNMTFIPVLAERLRQELAADKELLNSAWRVISKAHETAPVTIRLEELLTKLALSEEPGDTEQIESLLRGLLAEMLHNEQRAPGLARWAVGALPRLPAAVQRSEAAQMAALVASSRLGGWQPISALAVGNMDPTRAAWLLQNAATVTSGIRLLTNGVEFGDPTLPGAHPIQIPLTNPLLIDVEWQEPATLSSGSPVNSVAMLPDSSRIVSGLADGTLHVWDVENATVIQDLVGHTGPVTAVSILPDGQRAVSASLDATLKLWDLESGAELRTFAGHSDTVTSIAVLPDGRRALSGSVDATLILWDLETGAEIRTLRGHRGAVTAVAVLPDGIRALSASVDNNLILWDLEKGKDIRTLTGSTEQVTSIAILPDGRNAVSTSADGNIRLWNLQRSRARA